MASDEDVPPLEDMSELIQQVDALRELKKGQQLSRPLQNGHGDTKVPNGSEQAKQNVKAEHQKDAASVKIPQPDTKDSKPNTSLKSTPTNISSASSPSASASSSATASSTFGGLKKGFLFGGAPEKAAVKKPDAAAQQTKTATASSDVKTSEDIPFVKKTDSQKSGYRFSEVQEAMAKTNEKLMQNKEWVTDDLLTKLEKNEKLAKRLQDPTFVRAIGEFQQNPQQALLKYGENKEVQEFFQDFCGLMGEHFNKLADSTSGPGSAPPPVPNPQATISSRTPQGGADLSVRSSTNPRQATAQDEARMQEILSDPEIREILVEPKIQQLFESLRNNPANSQRILQTSDPSMRAKIHKLVQAGLLQFQG
ncbi:uncharacterized protein LOC127853959 [Dreissena polymorpha]|uniref:STI1 domain-containing protein n=1 Tax=Dreissena polymorpha TaxID=45954 RepID=A0A9D4CQF4_DREPO|nr:uncharacterized protein LOC127853959 [Dreissena polymorpha]KAH3728971.1 hypothetical protein DPMN_054934 [Dreissena polymorpha]